MPNEPIFYYKKIFNCILVSILEDDTGYRGTGNRAVPRWNRGAGSSCCGAPAVPMPIIYCNNEEPRGTAEYRGIGSKTWFRFGTGRSVVCIRFARDGIGANFYAPCHSLFSSSSLIMTKRLVTVERLERFERNSCWWSEAVRSTARHWSLWLRHTPIQASFRILNEYIIIMIF
jgi:hypothetical protein